MVPEDRQTICPSDVLMHANSEGRQRCVKRGNAAEETITIYDGVQTNRSRTETKWYEGRSAVDEKSGCQEVRLCGNSLNVDVI